METLSERLTYLLKERGLSQSELARKTGLRQQSIFKICAGQSKRTRYLYELAAALHVNPEWLATGSGDRNLISSALLNPNETVLVVPVLKPHEIAAYLAKTKEGGWLEFDETQQTLSVVCGGSSRTYAVKMQGDSMSSPQGGLTIPEGAFVIIDPDKAVSPFDLIVGKADVGSSTVIRQFLKEVDQVFLKPLNPRYPLSEINEEKLITYGVVIKTIILPK